MAGNFTVDHTLAAAEVNQIVGIAGRLSSTAGSPTIVAGTGFTVTMPDAHTYNISFSTAFTVAPLVVATPRSLAAVAVTLVSAGTCQLQLGALGGGFADNTGVIFLARPYEIGA